MTKQFVLPSEIPWNDIKGYELEELLYWLFVETGAKDLEWRIGGSGDGTSDSGRDLELSFNHPDIDGFLVKQKWWVDAKGRQKTVEKITVQNSVINALGDKNVDVIVIATNTQFSNPTRDWVKDWQNNNPRPIVKLWERANLERMCSDNPNVVIRFFENAISIDGKLKVTETRFWDYATYSGEIYLEELWEKRDVINLESNSLLALIASEFANGNIEKRAWGAYCSTEELNKLLANSILNSMYLLFKTEKNGASKYPIIQSLPYIILCSLLRNGLDATYSILDNVWKLHDKEIPDKVKNIVFEPVINCVLRDLFDICTNDCKRVIGDKYGNLDYSSQNYMARFEALEIDTDSESMLIIESKEEPCRFDFNLEKFKGCPLNNYEFEFENIGELLLIAQTILSS